MAHKPRDRFVSPGASRERYVLRPRDLRAQAGVPSALRTDTPPSAAAAPPR
jgi:hypothetical protein